MPKNKKILIHNFCVVVLFCVVLLLSWHYLQKSIEGATNSQCIKYKNKKYCEGDTCKEDIYPPGAGAFNQPCFKALICDNGKYKMVPNACEGVLQCVKNKCRKG